MTEYTLDFAWSDLTLSGSLRLPEKAGLHPVAVMVQGSGPSDRTSNGYFLPIQDALLARGIGCFAFDKPGCGESSGDWRDYALVDRADQVRVALATVRNHLMVDPEKTGVWGHSQGGWIVQMLASQSNAPAFAVAGSGPSITPRDQDLYGCEHTMRAKGRSDADIEGALAYIQAVHTAAGQGVAYQDAEAQFLASARSQPWYGYLTVADEDDWKLVCRFVQEGYDPLVALRQILTPYLGVYGGCDLLLPVWKSAQESSDALERAGNPDATVVVFPRGDHRMRDSESGEFVQGYLELLVDWISRRTT